MVNSHPRRLCITPSTRRRTISDSHHLTRQSDFEPRGRLQPMRHFKFHTLLLIGFVGWKAISDQVAPSCGPCCSLESCSLAPTEQAAASLPPVSNYCDRPEFLLTHELKTHELGDLSRFSMTLVSRTQSSGDQPSLQESKSPLDDER
jgi:hypothetical protein